VPKQAASPSRRVKTGTDILLIIASVITAIVAISALAAFGYETYLKSERDKKADLVIAAQREINMDTIESFVRLRNRLKSTSIILDQHVILSQFFTVLEMRSLQSVHFKKLSLKVNDDRTAELDASGVARSFNALAAQSASFADEKRIKSAIFSDIAPSKDGVIGFKLSADLDSGLIVANSSSVFGSPVTPAPAPVPVVPIPEPSPAAPAAAAPATTTTP